MKKYLHLLSTVCFVVILNASAKAQQNANVSGKVTASGKPIEAASVSMLKAKDSSLIKIEVSDKQGNFEFDNVKPGKYLLQTTANLFLFSNLGVGWVNIHPL